MVTSSFRDINYILKIYGLVQTFFGPASSPLYFQTYEQLAIAVILSAQCTDERVNQTTPALFKKYPNMLLLSNAPLSDIEKLIYSTGFYKNKAKNILELSNTLVKKHHSKIPNNFQTLLKLPGIGRKTANVIMNQAFKKSSGIVVDTHVQRISQILQFTDQKTPITIERDLMKIWPKEVWIDFSLYLVFLGRKFCVARKPKCTICILNYLCPTNKKTTDQL